MDKFRPDRKPQHSTQEDSWYHLIRQKGSGFRVYWNHEDEPQKSYCLPWPYNAISSDPHCTTSGAEDSINAETCSRPIDQEAPGQSLDTPLKNRVIHSDLFSPSPSSKLHPQQNALQEMGEEDEMAGEAITIFHEYFGPGRNPISCAEWSTRGRRPVKEQNVALLSHAGNEWLCIYAVSRRFLKVDLKKCFPILIPASLK